MVEENGEKDSEAECPATKMTFRKRVTNPKNIPPKEDKLAPTKKVLPYFVDYLDNKLRARKKEAYDKLLMNDRNARFCSLLKKYNTRIQKPHKDELVNSLKERSDFMNSRGQYLIKMYTLNYYKLK